MSGEAIRRKSSPAGRDDSGIVIILDYKLPYPKGPIGILDLSIYSSHP